jgi:hypothetical protein
MKPGPIAAWAVAAVAGPGLAPCGPAAANQVTPYYERPIVWG